jgi:hypothetical protein
LHIVDIAVDAFVISYAADCDCALADCRAGYTFFFSIAIGK